MLVGQDNYVLTKNGDKIKISSIHGRLDDVMVDDDTITTILSIKHHKKYKIMTKIILSDDTYVIVGKHTYVQVIEEHDIGRIVEAMDVHPGQLLCPALPPYADIRLWGNEHGIPIKMKQTIFYNASTILFDECEHVKINGAPILHDNYEFKNIRRIIKRKNSVGNLLFKKIGKVRN